MALIVVYILLILTGSVHSTQRHDGVTVRIVTENDNGVIYSALARHATQFNALTGANVQMIPVVYNQLYSEIMQDLSSGTNVYDGFVYVVTWISDFFPYFVDLTTLVRDDAGLRWPDLFPYFREFAAEWNHQVISIPLDGDLHMMYYRSDIFTQYNRSVPKTWLEFVDAAHFFNGLDLNGDGEPDFGSCVTSMVGGQAFYMVLSIAAAYIQSLGTYSGFFFDQTTMEPLVDNDAFAEALNIYYKIIQYGPDTRVYSMNLNTSRALMMEGRCALTYEWGDIGPLSVAPGSKVAGKVASAVLPGSTQVLDRVSKKLVQCTPEICPYAVKGVNHAPYACGGQWSGSISSFATPEVQKAAYDFFSFCSQPEQSGVDVTIGSTGMNPYRLSHTTNLSLWEAQGFTNGSAVAYLKGITDSLQNPNLAMDLKAEHTAQYQDALDHALDLFLRDAEDATSTMANLSQEWMAITNKLGLAQQRKSYLDSLGAYFPLPTPYVYPNAAYVMALVMMSVVVIACVAGIAFFFNHRRHAVIKATSIKFNLVSVVGCLFMAVTPIAFSIEPTDISCRGRWWVFLVSFNIVVGCFFFKTFRVWRFFAEKSLASTAAEASRLTDQNLLLMTGLFTIFPMTMLSISGSLNPNTALTYYDEVSNQQWQYCSLDPLVLTALAYEGLLLVAATVVAILARKAPPAFNESQSIGWAVYNLSLVVLVTLPINLVMERYPGFCTYTNIIALNFGNIVMLISIVGPKVVEVYGGSTTIETVRKQVSESVQKTEDSKSKQQSRMRVQLDGGKTAFEVSDDVGELKVAIIALRTEVRSLIEETRNLRIERDELKDQLEAALATTAAAAVIPQTTVSKLSPSSGARPIQPKSIELVAVNPA